MPPTGQWRSTTRCGFKLIGCCRVYPAAAVERLIADTGRKCLNRLYAITREVPDNPPFALTPASQPHRFTSKIAVAGCKPAIAFSSALRAGAASDLPWRAPTGRSIRSRLKATVAFSPATGTHALAFQICTWSSSSPPGPANAPPLKCRVEFAVSAH